MTQHSQFLPGPGQTNVEAEIDLRELPCLLSPTSEERMKKRA